MSSLRLGIVKEQKEFGTSEPEYSKVVWTHGEKTKEVKNLRRE